MAVLPDQDGLVTALEQLPGLTVDLVEELRIDAVHLTYIDREIALGGLDLDTIC